MGRNKPCYFKSSRYHLTIKRNSLNVICFLLSNSNPNQTANKWLLYIIIIITWSKEPDHDKLPEATQQINLDFSRLLDLMFCAWQRDVIRPFGLSYYHIQDPLIIRRSLMHDSSNTAIPDMQRIQLFLCFFSSGKNKMDSYGAPVWRGQPRGCVFASI